MRRMILALMVAVVLLGVFVMPVMAGNNEDLLEAQDKAMQAFEGEDA